MLFFSTSNSACDVLLWCGAKVTSNNWHEQVTCLQGHIFFSLPFFWGGFPFHAPVIIDRTGLDTRHETRDTRPQWNSQWMKGNTHTLSILTPFEWCKKTKTKNIYMNILLHRDWTRTGIRPRTINSVASRQSYVCWLVSRGWFEAINNELVSW